MHHRALTIRVVDENSIESALSFNVSSSQHDLVRAFAQIGVTQLLDTHHLVTWSLRSGLATHGELIGPRARLELLVNQRSYLSVG